MNAPKNKTFGKLKVMVNKVPNKSSNLCQIRQNSNQTAILAQKQKKMLGSTYHRSAALSG
jgi:hypothetical protein